MPSLPNSCFGEDLVAELDAQTVDLHLVTELDDRVGGVLVVGRLAILELELGVRDLAVAASMCRSRRRRGSRS